MPFAGAIGTPPSARRADHRLSLAMSDRTDFRRLILQIERDLFAQANLRRRLTAADRTVAGHREELRIVKARMKRTQRINGAKRKS